MIERLIVGALRTNCYFFSINKKECIIIDPGGDEELIISRIEVLHMVPVGIVFTHGHFDHTLAAMAIKNYYKEKGITIKLAIHEKDKSYLGHTAERVNRKHIKILGVEAEILLNQSFTSLPKANILLHEGDKVFNSKLNVLETPGHSKGSICLYSKTDAIIFTGDTLFFEGVGRADLPDSDEEELLLNIKNKILSLPPETSIFPGHGPLTKIEREIKGNPFFQ